MLSWVATLFNLTTVQARRCFFILLHVFFAFLFQFFFFISIFVSIFLIFFSFSKDHKYFTQRTITAEIALCLSTCSTFWFLSQNHETRKMKNQKCIFFLSKNRFTMTKKNRTQKLFRNFGNRRAIFHFLNFWKTKLNTFDINLIPPHLF